MADSSVMKKKLLNHKNKKFMEHIFNRSKNTSNEDVRSLKEDYGTMVPVFIYDSLMKGAEDDAHLQEMAFLGPATTLDDQWVLLQNAYHAVMIAPTNLVMNHFNLHKGNVRRVQGELYGVPIETVFWLDQVYDNDSTFVCDTIDVMLHQSDEPDGGILVKNVLCYAGEIKSWTKPVTTAHSVQVSPNVINSQYTKVAERVYRAYKTSPVKLIKDEWAAMTEEDWRQMGFDGYMDGGYGYGGR